MSLHNTHLALPVSIGLLLIAVLGSLMVRKWGKPVRSSDIRLLVRRWLCAAVLLVPVIVGRTVVRNYANHMGDDCYSLVMAQYLLGEWLPMTLSVVLALILSFAMFGVALAQSVFVIVAWLQRRVPQGARNG